MKNKGLPATGSLPRRPTIASCLSAQLQPQAPQHPAERHFEIRRENQIEGYVMNCQNHPEVPATAYCRACGKPVCDECRRDSFGTVFCAEHVPAAAGTAPGGGPWAPPGAPPFTGPQPFTTTSAGPGMPGSGPFGPGPQGRPVSFSDVSPGLAFFLGWIPGVGAIYNGQYAKGLVHAIVWGVMVSIINSGGSRGLEPIFGRSE